MLYFFEVSTPANTLEGDSKRTVLPLNRGSISKVGLLFPTGCAGLLHVRLRRFGRQVFPTSTGESFAGDGTLIEWMENYLLDEEPFSMELETWNDDDSYPHKVYVSIEVMRPFRVGMGEYALV